MRRRRGHTSDPDSSGEWRHSVFGVTSVALPAVTSTALGVIDAFRGESLESFYLWERSGRRGEPLRIQLPGQRFGAPAMSPWRANLLLKWGLRSEVPPSFICRRHVGGVSHDISCPTVKQQLRPKPALRSESREAQVAAIRPVADRNAPHRKTLPFPVLQPLLLILLSLDAFEYFGARYWPELTGGVLCSARMLGLIATPLVPADWPGFVATSCLTNPADPALSMITLMIKTSFAILSLLVALPFIAILSIAESRPGAPDKDRNSMPFDLGRPIRDVRAFVFFSAVVGFAWYLIVSRAPERLGASLFDKIVLEDPLILGLFACGGMLVMAFAPISRFLISLLFRRMNRNGDR
jgi:hypothetical protein